LYRARSSYSMTKQAYLAIPCKALSLAGNALFRVLRPRKGEESAYSAYCSLVLQLRIEHKLYGLTSVLWSYKVSSNRLRT
jgi:hypothetical protein